MLHTKKKDYSDIYWFDLFHRIPMVYWKDVCCTVMPCPLPVSQQKRARDSVIWLSRTIVQERTHAYIRGTANSSSWTISLPSIAVRGQSSGEKRRPTCQPRVEGFLSFEFRDENIVRLKWHETRSAGQGARGSNGGQRRCEKVFSHRVGGGTCTVRTAHMVDERRGFWTLSCCPIYERIYARAELKLVHEASFCLGDFPSHESQTQITHIRRLIIAGDII
jgi:hypothetical protein